MQGSRARVRASRILAFSVLAAAVPQASQAACDGQWDLGGKWTLTQSNGYTVSMELRQSGSSLSGVAHFRSPEHYYGPERSTSEGLSGSVQENTVRFVVDWAFPGNPVGEYTGVIDSQGRIGGTTFDRNHPGARAIWHGDRAANCLVAQAPEPAPSRDKPLDRRGILLGATKDFPVVTVPAQPAQPALTARVNADVDLYDAPDGGGNVIGVLRQGQTVTLLAACGEDWCQIANPNGWAWGEFLD